MKKAIIRNRSSLIINEAEEGESIEEKFARIMENGEGITDGTQPIYTEKSEGVNPAYNIRTDRFEIALEGYDAITRSRIAKSEHAAKEAEKEKLPHIEINPDGEVGKA